MFFISDIVTNENRINIIDQFLYIINVYIFINRLYTLLIVHIFMCFKIFKNISEECRARTDVSNRQNESTIVKNVLAYNKNQYTHL